MNDKELKELESYFLPHSYEFLNYCNKNNKFKLLFYQKVYSKMFKIFLKILGKYYLFLLNNKECNSNDLELVNRFAKIILENKGEKHGRRK